MNTDGNSRGLPAGVRTVIPGSSSSPASLEGTRKLVHKTLIGKESKQISSKGNHKAERGPHHLSRQMENSRALPVRNDPSCLEHKTTGSTDSTHSTPKYCDAGKEGRS